MLWRTHTITSKSEKDQLEMNHVATCMKGLIITDLWGVIVTRRFSIDAI